MSLLRKCHWLIDHVFFVFFLSLFFKVSSVGFVGIRAWGELGPLGCPALVVLGSSWCVCREFPGVAMAHGDVQHLKTQSCV